MSGPSDSQAIAVSVVGTSAIDSPHATTMAVSRSRSEPTSGGMGAGGMRLMNAADTRSLALGKWRYSVALATLALRVTASIVTAPGPPERNSAVAASSKRARDRAGRGSPLAGPTRKPGTVIGYITSDTETRLSVSYRDC